MENRVAAFDFLETAVDLLENKVSFSQLDLLITSAVQLDMQDVMSFAVLACNDEAWQKGQSIQSR